MTSASPGDRSQPRRSRVPIAIGLFAAFVTSGVVSWLTPDGNLVVTLVPGLAVGLAVFALALRCFRGGGSN